MPRRVTRDDVFLRAAMRDHGASVLRLALAQTGSRADAEDVYQDVFVALACSDTEFADADHLRAWLLRATLNRCRDLARSWWHRHAQSFDALGIEVAQGEKDDAPWTDAQLWEAYLESFRTHAATTEGFIEWERELYVNSFTCAEDAFKQARLEAIASFSGGGTQTRRYRITLVDGYEQVLSERFGALLAIDDDFSQCLEEELPWHRYPTPTDEQIAADPRLSEPIFQIEDVTEA